MFLASTSSVKPLQSKMGADVENGEVEGSLDPWKSLGFIAWHLFWNGVHYLFAAIAVALIVPPYTSDPSQTLVFANALPPILIAYSIACVASLFRRRYAIVDALIYLAIVLFTCMLNYSRVLY